VALRRTTKLGTSAVSVSVSAMTTILEIAAAQASFSEVIANVEQGESVILTQSGIPVARLIPHLDLAITAAS